VRTNGRRADTVSAFSAYFQLRYLAIVGTKLASEKLGA
jgi:hypothetical protein